MRNKIITILIALVASMSVFSLVACGEDDSHTHVFDRQLKLTDYLKSYADCENKAVYYYSCECGEKGTETFEDGTALGHKYSDWECIGNGQHEKVCSVDNSHIEKESCVYIDGLCQLCGEEFYTIGLTFTLINNDLNYSVTGYTGSNKTACIPNYYKGLPVTSIGDGAFKNCSSLTNVTIQDNITSIGASAFEGCSKLVKFKIPKNLISVGNNAFKECSSLAYNEKDGLNYLGNEDNKYYYLVGVTNKNITTAKVEESCKIIGSLAFLNCELLTSVTIPNGITCINSEAFKNCSSLSSVVLSENLTSIGEYAFANCSALKNILIYKGVEIVGSNAFYNCLSLEIGCEVKSQPSGWADNWNSSNCVVYWDTNGLITVDYLNYFVAGNNARVAKQSSYIASANIPEKIVYKNETFNVTKIEDNAFEDCIYLTSVTIPKTVESLTYKTFSGCSSLESISVDEDNTKFKTIDGVLYTIDEKTLIKYPACKSGAQFIIPNSVTKVEPFAFEKNLYLEDVNILFNVESIGEGAFYTCNNIKKLTFHHISFDVTKYHFYDYSSLTYDVKDKLAYIGNKENPYLYFIGVTDNTITSAVIDSSCKYMGGLGFAICYNLKYVTLPDSLISVDYATFNDYVALTYNVKDGLKYLGSVNNPYLYLVGAVSDESAVTEINIDKNCKIIGYKAFYGCSELTTVTIPENVKSIGAGAFYGCKKLVEVVNNSKLIIEKGSKNNGYVGYYAINVVDDNNDNVHSVITDSNGFVILTEGNNKVLVSYNGNAAIITIPNGITAIKESAFYGNTTIKNVIIPNTVISIGANAFYKCTSLESVTLPSNLTTLGHSAFYKCCSLKGIIIPDKVTSIESNTFGYCSSLTSVTVGSRVSSIGKFAFLGCYKLADIINKSNIIINRGTTDNGYIACYA